MITIPNWREHMKTAHRLGIGKTTAKRVNTLLDFPDRILGKGKPKLTHKSLHNPAGILLCEMLWGPDAGRFAMEHLLDDLWSEYMKKAMGNLLTRW